MSNFTRRDLLSLAGGGAGLAACQTRGAVAAPVSGEVRFDHGVASGDAEASRVILWTRVTPAAETAGPITVIWQMFDDEAMSDEVQAGAVQTSAVRDYTVKVDVAGLAPARNYYYAFSVFTDQGVVASPRGRTRTLPASGPASGTTALKLALVSCSNYPFGLFNVYDALAREPDLDLIIHLGDYLYEYGPDGYGGEAGRALGREHVPPREITALADYRARHAQYKSDKALQRAHAAAPWVCTWDDHESANDSYRTGAENHDPDTEGQWTTRKQLAVQAYLEWMPVRDPAPGAARSSLWRVFELGDLASLICLETRLTGRSEEISWTAELVGLSAEAMPAVIEQTLSRVNDPARTMLGAEQEAWLAQTLARSTGAGKRWQILANQTLMATTRLPDFTTTLTPDEIAAAIERAGGFGDRLRAVVQFSSFGLPANLDSWDGFPAARERLYAAAEAAGASLVTLTGDTHSGWANRLRDRDGRLRGVEFGCTSVTSPGVGAFLQGVDGVGEMYVEANRDVVWFDPDGHGFTVLTLSDDGIEAHFRKVSTITAEPYAVSEAAAFQTDKSAPGELRLKK